MVVHVIFDNFFSRPFTKQFVFKFFAVVLRIWNFIFIVIDSWKFSIATILVTFFQNKPLSTTIYNWVYIIISTSEHRKIIHYMFNLFKSRDVVQSSKVMIREIRPQIKQSHHALIISGIFSCSYIACPHPRTVAWRAPKIKLRFESSSQHLRGLPAVDVSAAAWIINKTKVKKGLPHTGLSAPWIMEDSTEAQAFGESNFSVWWMATSPACQPNIHSGSQTCGGKHKNNNSH